MSAIFGALALFYVLAFATTTVAFASDSFADMRSPMKGAAVYPVDSMSDDERILTTSVATPERTASATADSTEHSGKVAHAA